MTANKTARGGGAEVFPEPQTGFDADASKM